MDGILINNGTVAAVLYGYRPGWIVPAGQTLVAMASVAGFKPGAKYVPLTEVQSIGTPELAAALVQKGVLTTDDLRPAESLDVDTIDNLQLVPTNTNMRGGAKTPLNR